MPEWGSNPQSPIFNQAALTTAPGAPPLEVVISIMRHIFKWVKMYIILFSTLKINTVQQTTF